MKNIIYQCFISIIFILFVTGCEVGITPLEEGVTNQDITLTVDIVNDENDTGTIAVNNVPDQITTDDFHVVLEGNGSEYFNATVVKNANVFNISVLPKDNFSVKVDTTFIFYATVFILDKPSCKKEITIMLPGVNNAPTIMGRPETSINEDTSYYFTPRVNDIDGDTLSYSIINKPSWGSFNNRTGTLSGTPRNIDVGVTTGIIISVNDGTVDVALPAFDIMVLNTNDAPIAVADVVSMNEDTNVTIILQGNDVDTGAVLTYHIVDYPANGSVIITENSATYVPEADYFGTDGFTFEVKDEFNATSDTANIDINIRDVAEPNTPPIVQDMNISMDVNISSITIDLNASDADVMDTLIYSIVTNPAFGSLTINTTTGQVIYNKGTYTGNTSFTYKVNDGMIDSNIATVYIKSNIPNSPPIAYDQSVNLDVNGVPIIVLDANDTDMADTLSYRVVIPPSYGTVSLLGHQVTYTPNPNYTGNDSFKFVANDGTDDSNEALVYIEVGNTQLSSQLFAWCDVNDVELWRSDGTQGGTGRVKDIRSIGSAIPQSFVKIKNTYFFMANDGIHGKELWKSQGTEGSTVLVKDIKTKGNGHTNPHNLININGTLFFAAKDGKNGIELWKSDGTKLGTKMVKNINKRGHSAPQNLTNVNGILYFTASDGVHGRELWRSDGTLEGTEQVNDINPNGSSAPKYLTNVNGVLYFSAYNESLGRELWYYNTNISDQASGYTNRGFMDIYRGTASGDPTKLFNYNGTLVFAAENGVYGVELWRVENMRGVKLVENFAGVSFFESISAYPHAFSVIDTKLYFSATEASTGYNLRYLDDVNGSPIENVQYIDQAGNKYLFPNPENLVNVNGTLFFDMKIITKDQNGNVTKEQIYLGRSTDTGATSYMELSDRKALYTYDIINNELLFRTTKTDNGEELWISNMNGLPTKLTDGCGL